jgi:hypothetical protein
MDNHNQNIQNNQTDLVAIPQATMDQFYKLPNGNDVASLYNFLYYTANWQQTNQAKATMSYCTKHFKWGKERFHKAKTALIAMGLLENVQTRDEKGKVTGWYVRLSYKMKRKTLEERVYTPPVIQSDAEASRFLPSHQVAGRPTNAYSTVSINAYSNGSAATPKQKQEPAPSQLQPRPANNSFSKSQRELEPPGSQREGLTKRLADAPPKKNRFSYLTQQEIYDIARDTWSVPSRVKECEKQFFMKLHEGTIYKVKDTVAGVKKFLEYSKKWEMQRPEWERRDDLFDSGDKRLFVQAAIDDANPINIRKRQDLMAWVQSSGML